MLSLELLDQFDPKPDDLLRAISANVDDSMLAEISMADYGEGAERHLGALQTIRDELLFPLQNYSWYPSEVLELIRWSKPEDKQWKPGGTGIRGHWMRAFCCASLLRALFEPWNWGTKTGSYFGVEPTIAQLLASLSLLPVEYSGVGVSFFAWMLTHEDLYQWQDRDEIDCMEIGVIFLATRSSMKGADAALTEIAKDLARSFEAGPSPGWILTPQTYDAWRQVANQCLDCDLSSSSEELKKCIAQFRDTHFG
jgi:hypothetical protein